ncbi:MAG TPA: HNH endonuclease signature motif containing protein [Gemmatimonadaceae bacterium]|jgi:hypothetical protein|nr:HNH endonuclease signature motif containing protein [Gemmatimonadaceae bacterium]
MNDILARIASPSLARRFFAKTVPEPNSGCLLWTASAHVNGYGRFAISKRIQERAHRVAWLIRHGEIPNGLCVLHRCDVPACVNVDHLFLGTLADNNADMMAKGRNRNVLAERARRTPVCSCGTPFTLARRTRDGIVRPAGKRVCKSCQQRENAERYRLNRIAILAKKAEQRRARGIAPRQKAVA